MVGEVIADRYELQELVGSGGMSTVYRAYDRDLQRTVAVKVLHSRYADDDEYTERFRREARMAAQLSHPGVVLVIERGDHGDRPYIVFEYVEGENLKQLVDREGPLPVERALELAIQVARGLSVAHGKGLVHRDVKPQNILLNGSGQAKVTDFGIARSLEMQGGVTQTGAVLGTSDYLSPEQAQGGRVSESSDVYSLGVVLYEMLTGELPFAGDNFVAVAMQHINQPAPWVTERRPDVREAFRPRRDRPEGLLLELGRLPSQARERGGEVRRVLSGAARDLEDHPLLREDASAHSREHAIEVQLPFLHRFRPDVRIVPVALGRLSLEECRNLGENVADAIAGDAERPLLVASSDMSHYVPDAVARKKDQLAIDRMLALDPEGLYRTVRSERISMCGVLPATVVLFAARRLGATSARLIRYATSGDVSRDFDQVVGYAGLAFR